MISNLAKHFALIASDDYRDTEGQQGMEKGRTFGAQEEGCSTHRFCGVICPYTKKNSTTGKHFFLVAWFKSSKFGRTWLVLSAATLKIGPFMCGGHEYADLC